MSDQFNPDDHESPDQADLPPRSEADIRRDIAFVLAPVVVPSDPTSKLIWHATSDRVVASRRVARELLGRLDQPLASLPPKAAARKQKTMFDESVPESPEQAPW